MTIPHSLRSTSSATRAAQRLDDLFGIDLRGLAAFRVAIGLLLFAEGAIRIRAFAIPAGPSLVAWLDLDWLVLLACGAAIAAGRGAKLACLIAWPLLFRHIMLDCQTVKGVEIDRYLLLIGVFWILLTPSDLILRIGGNQPGAAPPRRVLSYATAALLIQVFLVYFSAGAAKAHLEWVVRADALQNLMQTHYATPLGRSLTAFPWLLGGLSVGTIALEVGGAVACFLPARRLATIRNVVLLVATGFHVGLLLTMNLQTIPLVCQAYWLLLIPTVTWDRLWPRPDLSSGTVGEPSALVAAVSKAMLAGMVASFLLSTVVLSDPSGTLLRLHRATPRIGIYQDWRMFRSPATLREMETSPADKRAEA